MTPLGTPVFRRQIFSEINRKNFAAFDPAKMATNEQNGMRPGLYVHLGHFSPQVHKATLQSKYGITTEYVDELQLKWQQLKARSAIDHIIPNPAQPSSDDTLRFDPLSPVPNVWNNFYLDRRDAVMSEIFTQCVVNKVSFQHLMSAVLPFFKARQQNRRVDKGDAAVKQNMARIIANEQLVNDCYSQIFDYLEFLLLNTPPPEQVLGDNTSQEEATAIHTLKEDMGQDFLTYAKAYKYVSQIYITWLEDVCRNNKPSPSSGREHLLVAPDMVKYLRQFPSFVPATTFVQQFDGFQHVFSAYADWMRIKFSREDYLLRLKYAHDFVLSGYTDQVLTLGRESLKQTVGMDDEYVQILCIVWSKLGVKPQPWMMHFSHSDEAIRQVAQQRAAAGVQGAGQSTLNVEGGKQPLPVPDQTVAARAPGNFRTI